MTDENPLKTHVHSLGWLNGKFGWLNGKLDAFAM